MASCVAVALSHDGFAYLAPDPLGVPASCQAVILSGAEYASFVQGPEFASLGIDAANVAAAFSFGFGAVFFFWYLGYLVKIAQDAIRKV